MTVLQMLSKMIGTEKLFCLVALTEFVHVIEMVCAGFPDGRVGEFLAAVAADVCVGSGGGGVEGGLRAQEGGAGPGVPA